MELEDVGRNADSIRMWKYYSCLLLIAAQMSLLARPFIDFSFPKKTIHGTDLVLSLRPDNKEDQLTLAILFRSNDGIKYDHVEVSAMDTDGKAMRVIPSGENNGDFWEVANWKQGHYQFFVKGGQKLFSIKVKWKGEEITVRNSEGQGMPIEGLLKLDK